METTLRIDGGRRWNFKVYDSVTDATKACRDARTAMGSAWRKQSTSGFTGHYDLTKCLHDMENGNLANVSKSDALLTKFESLLAVNSSKFKIVDDVAGAIPNVPAYLAGHPLTMRRRQRTQSELAPLCVIVDACVSAGFNERQIMQRGVALLALVRALSAVRPIELWAGLNLGSYKDSKIANGIFMRIDTSPLDLARSTFILSHVSFLRSFGFEFTGNTMEKASVDSIPWGFNSADTVRKLLPETMKTLLQRETVFCVPGMSKDDKHLDNPEAWLKQYLAEYGGEAFADLELTA